jgi:hypothetical protein
MVKFISVPRDGLFESRSSNIETSSNSPDNPMFVPIIPEIPFMLRNIIMINPVMGNPIVPNAILPALIFVIKKRETPVHPNESAVPNGIVAVLDKNDFKIST